MPAGTQANPPDRSHITTEQRNERSLTLDAMSSEEVVRLMNDEDATVAASVRRASREIAALVDALVPRVARGGRLVYLGAGTSGRLGVLDASECPPTFQAPPHIVVGIIAGGDASLRKSSEGMEDDPLGAQSALDELRLGAGDTVLGIAAGGTTPFVLGGLEHADRRGAVTALLSCCAVCTPPQVRHHIIVETGPEILTGSTRLKAGTATKLVLNSISTALFVRLGKCYENLMVDLRASNAKLRDRAARIVATLCGLPRDSALDLLASAGGSVKHAVIVHKAGCTVEQAERRLAEAGGVLRRALEA